MKDFMFIIRGQEAAQAKRTPEQTQGNMQKWMNWIGELSAKGQFVGGAPLSKEGKIVKGLKQVVTDGPFTEGKELLGGYLIIKANSMEEATKLTSGFPDFDIAFLEVREVIQMDMHQ
jgi:hypothetical protein